MRGAEEITWPGGVHSFRLGIGELRAIEQKCDAGVFQVFLRLVGQSAKIDDIIAPLRIGLVGGGMTEQEAKKTIDAALDVASPYELIVTAGNVLRLFIMWEGKDNPEGEAEAGTETQPDPRLNTTKPDGDLISQ